MKKHLFVNLPVHRIVKRVILTGIIVVAGIVTQAQTEKVKQTIMVPTASVSYTGTIRDDLSVAVKYDNAAGHPFTVTVKDQDGYLLYQGNFYEKKFNKTFRVPKAQASMLRFEIRNAKTGELQTFEINTKEAEQMAVKRVG